MFETVTAKLSRQIRTPSAFYVPKMCHQPVKNRLRALGLAMPQYLRILLRFAEGLDLPKFDGAKVVYQGQGLELVRMNFTPRNEDWVRLGQLALSMGVSRAWLFVWLFQKEAGSSNPDSPNTRCTSPWQNRAIEAFVILDMMTTVMVRGRRTAHPWTHDPSQRKPSEHKPPKPLTKLTHREEGDLWLARLRRGMAELAANFLAAIGHDKPGA